ncbi:MAG: L,D-transpeptidase [Rhizobiales bacterium]|nr:L,D-transpeptidase [Hyphomicrobiales bacterium]
MNKLALSAVCLGLLVSVSARAQDGSPAPRGVIYAERGAIPARPVSVSERPMTAYAEPASAGRRGGMGGGFIEYLFNGGELPPAPRNARAVPAQPMMGAPETTIEQRVIPLQRRAARTPDLQGVPDQPAVPRGMDPRFLPQTVAYQTSQRPGTIVIDTRERFLYLVEANGMARRYGVGVGRPGFGWTGAKTITRKAEWPDWRPPADMLRRRPDLPRFMAGGPANPLGARAMYLGSSLYRIHGSNEPHTIGTYVSSGCFRMRNEDVTDLYERVRVGTKVVVL